MLRTSRLGFGVAVAALVFSLASTVSTRPHPAGAAQGFVGSKTRFAPTSCPRITSPSRPTLPI